MLYYDNLSKKLISKVVFIWE